MKREERLPLLERMELLAVEEAENLPSKVHGFLALPNHQLALRPEIVVVRGGRGAGKSALFQLLKELGPAVREFFSDDRVPDATWIDAFSQQGRDHPEVMVLDALARTHSDSALRAFWLAHLVTRVVDNLEGISLPKGFRERVAASPTQPEKWVDWAEANVGALAAVLDKVEQQLEGRYLFAAYDHLDRIGQFEREVRGRYVATLLSMWLSLSNRYRNLRAKIFLRDDLFDAAERSFPDASKLRPRSVSLEWNVEDLYRVVVRHLLADGDGRKAEALAGKNLMSWLRGVSKLQLEKRGRFGWMPGPMHEPVQKAFAKALAGELMGSGANKGFTYRWIPNRLQDAKTRIVPRSMLNLLGLAATRAKQKPLDKGPRLLVPQDLVGALEEVSKRRAKEVAQEYRLVGRLNNLSGLLVLLGRDEVVRRLSQPIPGEAPGLSQDGEMVLEELVNLGVLSIRSNGKIDVPDIYRYGFRIKRKGGVARPK